MRISREYALEELKLIRKNLDQWIGELEQPRMLDREGEEVDEYPEGVPQGLQVDQVRSIPTEQLRAELTAMAGKLEVLAST